MAGVGAGLEQYVLSHRLNPKVSVSIVFVLAMFVTIMDSTIVNVALPTLARQFHLSPDRIDGVVVGFLVSLAVVIPASGWLGDRLGTKRVFLAALALFTLASALCGLAQSYSELVGFRILQGVGGGMLTPVGMAMLYRTFPQSERVRAARILVLPTALAPALGPVVGGLLVTDASWRWVFYVNVPIGIVGIVFGYLFLTEHREPAAGAFDLPGFALAGAGFASLMYALSEGPSRGWSSSLIIGLGLTGVILLAALVRVELRASAPLIDLRVLRDRLFRTTTGSMFLGTMAFLGVLYLVALFFQDGLGFSALDSGLSTFPEAIGIMVGSQFASRLYRRAGPRRLMVGGLIGLAVTTGSLSLVGLDTNIWLIRGVMLAVGLAMAFAVTPGQAAAFARISAADTGRASTLFNASRQLGSAVGVAVLSTVVAAVGITTQIHGHATPHLAAYHWGFLTSAALALVAAGVALGVEDRAASATMQPVRRTPTDAPVLAESMS
jgi:EmrB/QacA subfamily drug resistance transporter